MNTSEKSSLDDDGDERKNSAGAYVLIEPKRAAHEYMENLGDQSSKCERCLQFLSRPKYRSNMYNTNGKNIYTSKATVPLTIVLFLSVMLIGLKYAFPLFVSSPIESYFKRIPLSNSIGLISNSTNER